MKKQYIAYFGDVRIYRDNWEQGEDINTEYGYDTHIKYYRFETIDDLRAMVVSTFTLTVDTKSIYIEDGDDNILTITWETVDEEGMRGVNKKDLDLFKQGKIDLFSCYMNVEVFELKTINCEKEFSNSLN